MHWGYAYKLIALVILSFAISITTHALVVTEIMYDPAGTDTGQEWIEVYNDTQDNVQLSSWKLFEANTNHSISTSLGDGSISPGEYAIVAVSGVATLSGYPSYTGDVYDSSFSLNNTGESFSFKTLSGDIVAQVTYVGGVLAAGDSNSLHWVGGQWVSRMPNPGADPNVATAGQQTSQQNNTGSGNTTSGSNQSQQANTNTPSTVSSGSTRPIVPIYAMTVRTVPKEPVAGAPFSVHPKIIRTLGEDVREYTLGRIRVITGDGREIVRQTTDPIQYVYSRSGNYRLIVEYSHSDLSSEPLAHYVSDIAVISPLLTIGRDGYVITITNQTDNEIDISRYILRTPSRSITIASHTVVLPSATISIGDSAQLLSDRPKLIELIAPNGSTKVASREFVVPDPVAAISSVSGSSNTSTAHTQQPFTIAATSQSSVANKLYASVRDTTLVQYDNVTTPGMSMGDSGSSLVRDISDVQTPNNKGTGAAENSQSLSIGSLMILSVVSLVTLFASGIYIIRLYYPRSQQVVEETMPELSEAESQGADEYVIVTHAASR